MMACSQCTSCPTLVREWGACLSGASAQLGGCLCNRSTRLAALVWAAGKLKGSQITLGARGDSLYEYLMKQILLVGDGLGAERRTRIEELYMRSVHGIETKLLETTKDGGFMYVNELSNNVKQPKMDHLVCFLPGTPKQATRCLGVCSSSASARHQSRHAGLGGCQWSGRHRRGTQGTVDVRGKGTHTHLSRVLRASAHRFVVRCRLVGGGRNLLCNGTNIVPECLFVFVWCQVCHLRLPDLRATLGRKLIVVPHTASCAPRPSSRTLSCTGSRGTKRTGTGDGRWYRHWTSTRLVCLQRRVMGDCCSCW